jgi:Anti-sigma-K factor rskA
MSEMPPMSPRDERLYDLAIAKATLGLSPAEARELAELQTGVASDELAAIDEAVAAITRGLKAETEVVIDEPMPEHLRQSLIAAAPDQARPRQIGDTRDSNDRDAVIASIRRSARTGWFVAAASLLLAGGLLLTRGGGPQPTPQPLSTQKLVDAATDVVRFAMGPTPDGAAGASGEIVWSNSLQKGYAKLKGVPTNDATQRQYQMWIVDPNRDSKPIDGGVFDVTGSGEVVISFEPRLPVSNPAAFAITAERPGGVVVSAGPLLMVAQAKSS